MSCRFLPAVAALLGLAAGSPATAEEGLLGGRVINVSATCGAGVPLAVQFLGSEVSPRVEVGPGETIPVSLPAGPYSLTILDATGNLVEESRLIVVGAGFRLQVGCVKASDAGPRERPQTDPGIPVRLVNTTADCGEALEVQFFVNSRDVGFVRPGETVNAWVPARDVLVEVFSAGRRLFSTHRSGVASGTSLFFGCTDPDAVSATSGIPVLFQNSTDECPDGTERRHLTLWIDRRPVLGLAPGGRAAVRVPAGRHVFEVFPGMTRQRVLKGVKDVNEPFRVHYGCGR